MKVRIKVIFDTSKWPEGDLRWKTGIQNGLFIICTPEEAMDKLESVYGLGHNAEVQYLEED